MREFRQLFFPEECIMTTSKMLQSNNKRIHWMDNLRTIIIFLVVLYHVGGVYEAGDLWGWFWIVDDPDTITWVGIVGIMFDIMVMPTIFFISGYLTPPSMDKHTGWGFVTGKFKRLMVPWLIAVFTLIPIYKVIFLYSRGFPQENWISYFHFNNPNSQNWLWFLPLLFFFNLIYFLVEKSGLRLPKISLVWAVVLTFVVSVGFSIVIGSLLGFRSWTLTPILDFENERLLANFCFYILGTICYRRNIFAELPKNKTLYTVANSVAWLPVTGHIFVRVWPFFVPDFSVTFLYRVIWFVSLHMSSLVMVYVMVESFWRYLDKTGKAWDELNKNSYGVYIIHVIMIGVFGTILLNVSLPAVVKWLLLILSTYLGSNLLVSLYRAGRKAMFSG
jgi:fucose 4-O-acetylase-like acetyltransferase